MTDRTTEISRLAADIDSLEKSLSDFARMRIFGDHDASVAVETPGARTKLRVPLEMLEPFLSALLSRNKMQLKQTVADL